MQTRRYSTILAAVAISACADSSTAPIDTPLSPGSTPELISEGRGAFQRYVAMGTSISMGVSADGVYAASQEMSFPAQLARLAHRELSLPLIAAPGCAAPIVAPLGLGVRLSGEPTALPFLSRACAPNEEGVTLPAGNVAIDGARTDQALTATPENPDPGHATQYPRVLAPGQSQVTAMEAQEPKTVSVELGANEILGAYHGFYLPGVNVVPVAFWAPKYREVAARVAAVAKHAVLVGLVDDLRSFPSFRTGAEIWNARATFAPLNVVVSDNCTNNTNVIFVGARIPAAAANGRALAISGMGPYTFSCANAPSATGIEDYVLDPNDIIAVNAQLAAMNAVIQDEARTHGFAYFPLGALYDRVVTKPPLNALALMTSTQPYGPYVSVDGLHPTAEGSRILADAAAMALNRTYRLGIPTSTGALAYLANR
jgi:hypothetical protein